MSATPYVPYKGALEALGILEGEKSFFTLPSKRVTKRWIIFGGVKPIPEALPNRMVVFSTRKPDLTHERHPNYVGLR